MTTLTALDASFLDELSNGRYSSSLGLDLAATAGLTVVATVTIYVVLFTVVRVLGARTLANLSTFDFACMVAIGAVVGRTAVTAHPGILTGVVAVVTLFALQGLFGLLRARRVGRRVVTPKPVVLIRDGVIDTVTLHRARLTEDELRFAVRRAGLPGLAAVGLAVLEANGHVSVIRAGEREAWIEADLSR